MKAIQPATIWYRFMAVGLCAGLLLVCAGCQSLRTSQPAPDTQGGLQPKTPAEDAWADASLYSLWWAIYLSEFATSLAHR